MDQIELGGPARASWTLLDGASYLNHGSYGACPRPVQAAQARLREQMEQHPDGFLSRVEPVVAGGAEAIRAVAARIAAFTGTTAGRVALVENATAGVATALAAARLEAGDEVLCTAHQYNAVRIAIERRCRATGAVPRVVELPLPTSPDEAVSRVLDAAGARTRLAVLDHITSPSALVLPLDLLLPEMRRRGIPVIVDGAHAIGQLQLDLAKLDADWYVSNAHKWLYAPRGSAVLHVSERAATTLPLVASHHVGLGFPAAFDYLGTRDYTAWLAVPAAVDFHGALGRDRLHRHNARLVDLGTRALESAGALPVAPRGMCAWMRAFELPQRRAATASDADAVMRTLWERERIGIRCAVLDGRLLLRFSAQAYVAEEEMTRLGEALARHGWPDRGPSTSVPPSDR